MKNTLRIVLVSLAFALTSVAIAQEHPAEAAPQGEQHQPAAEQAKPGEHSAGAAVEGPNATTDKHLSEASNAALHGEQIETPGQDEEEEYVQLKQSPSVKWVAQHLGTSPKTAYWLLFITNFVVLAGAIVWFMRSSIPAMMRTRTQNIQKGIEDARKASAEASARLGEIEARLAKLDGEVAALKATADQDFSAEEARIKAQAEQDAKHVVESAEAEIAAAARSAQRELKAFAADLSVSLAEKKIKVDASTDEALVRGFVAQLGKDGR